MNQILKSVEGCRIQPLQSKIASVSSFYDYDSYGFLGFIIWVAVCVGGFILLANIPTHKLWWVWLLPFVGATVIRHEVVKSLRGRDAVSASEIANERYHQESLGEAEYKTQNVKSYVDSSLRKIEELKLNITKTSTLIDQARSEYSENAYSPFWDKVHKSIEQLYNCQKDIESLSWYAQQYSDNLRKRQHNFPQFPIREGMIPDLNDVSRDLQRVIRLGQTNFKFSSIYEQIRTREVMIAGFNSLGEAVDKFGISVDRSLATFLSQLNATLSQTRQ